MEWKNPIIHVVLGLWLSLASASVLATPSEGGFLGKNSVEARRVLREYVENQPVSVIWARHLSALVFLERLTGNETEALAVWAKCNLDCRKLLPQDERAALQSWHR